jgi:MoxR-like ATPase
MDEERMVVRQNEGSYEKVNQVVSVEQILRAGRFAKYTWMKKSKYILDIVLPLDTQKI